MTNSSEKVEFPKRTAEIAAVTNTNKSELHIFGSENDNTCYYFDLQIQKYECIDEIPKAMSQKNVKGHKCAMFEIKNNDTNNTYALIYGGYIYKRCYYQIYDFQKKEFDKQIIKYNNLWFNDTNIIKGGQSVYGFGRHCSMITDIFHTNIIHIAGGFESQNKYAFFRFNHTFNQPNQSSFFYVVIFFLIFTMIVRFCVCFFLPKIAQNTHPYFSPIVLFVCLFWEHRASSDGIRS